MSKLAINSHRRNKSSIGSTTSFVVNSVVKQFSEDSASEDASYDSDNITQDAKENILKINNDYSSLYDENPKAPVDEPRYSNNENGDAAIPTAYYSEELQVEANEDNQVETKSFLDLENISLPTNIFDILQPNSKKLKDSKIFHKIFSESCIIKSVDDFLLKQFIAIVYNVDKKPNSFSCFIIDKFGSTFHKNLDISNNSKYYEAIHNLSPKHFDLNVSKCVAAAILQKYAYILKKYPDFIENRDMLNPVTAAKALDHSELINTDNEITPLQVCLKIQQFSLLNDRQIFSNFFDVVYDTDSLVDKMEQNNYLVSFLGEQLEQLFDPLTEYSPESMEQVYKPDSSAVKIQETDIINSIIKELISVQTYFTIDLVKFLTKFIIPLRIAITKKSVSNLTTSKFNAVFPPTIDEVTRINCIFLDALKISSEYSLKELIKSVDQTIQYFYKAYTRHEAATRNFNFKLNKFFEDYDVSDVVDRDVYTLLKIDTIINGPQEKLFKIKLILERLIKEKQKDTSSPLDEETKTQYDHIIDVIDQFGIENRVFEHEKESKYQQRVFTPSGKILTELATNWPAELQYKWLKRKVVGVFDCINEFTGLKNCIVIFSDYIVCMELLDDYDILNNPLLSDILMNSLINEKPLPIKIPKLRVHSFCQVSKTLITAYGGKGQLRMDLLNDEKPLYLQLINPSDSTEYICELVTKACILCKSSAFHLFKQVYGIRKLPENKGFNCYITAHDLKNYEKEKIKSPFAIFLNLQVNQQLLLSNNVYYGFFVNSVDDYNVEITILSQAPDFETEIFVCEVKDFNKAVMDKLTNQFFFEYYYSLKSPLIKKIISINEAIVDQIQEPLIKLKQSVLLNKKEMQRFSTIMNPNSPLVNNITSKILTDDRNMKVNENEAKLNISEQEPELLQKDEKLKSETIEGDVSAPVDSNVNVSQIKMAEPVKTKSVKISTSNNVIIPQKIVTDDRKKKENSNLQSKSNLPASKKPSEQHATKKQISKGRKKNRLSTFFGNLFNKKQVALKTEPKVIQKDVKKEKSKPLPLKPVNRNTVVTTTTPLKKTQSSIISSPTKESISSPMKIQRESYKEEEIPRLNSNLDKNLFRESRGSALFLSDNALKQPIEPVTKSPFVSDLDKESSIKLVTEDISSEINEEFKAGEDTQNFFEDSAASDNLVEIGEAHTSSFAQNGFNQLKLVYSMDNASSSSAKDDSFVYENNPNGKSIKISQSPSFRELFLKLESDLHPLSNKKNPNYWIQNNLQADGLENERNYKTKKSGIANLYESVILEEEAENEENQTKDENESKEDENSNKFQPEIFESSKDNQINESDNDINNKSTGSELNINTKFEKISTIPRHSPLETQFPALESSFDNSFRKPERYGNKFKVVRHEESVVSPVKSDFLHSPTKTPQIKSYNDDITDDIKTMTLDGVSLDIVSPIKNSSEMITANSNRIVSDLNIDFNEFNTTPASYENSVEQQLEPNSDLMTVFNDVNESKVGKEVVETVNKKKKFDIRSESFGYLSDFI